MFYRKAHTLFAHICTQVKTEKRYFYFLWWWATTFCWKRQVGHSI